MTLPPEPYCWVGEPHYPEETPMPNPLTDVLPERVRKVAYAVLFVLALGFSIWQASDGDWVEFAGGLITALFGATAASNVGTTRRRGDRGQVDGWLGVVVVVLLLFILLAVLGALPAAR